MSQIVEPVLTGRFNCEVGRADFFFDDPEFMQVIHRRIARADLIVADLSDLKPNVLYELGHCHMLGVPCVLFIDDIEKLPSDLRHQKAIVYTQTDLSNGRCPEVRAQFQAQVAGLRGFVARDMPSEAKPRLIDRMGLTVVEELHHGRRDHYEMARRLVALAPPKLFLMQRSSSLVLGPEAEWGDESGFCEALWSSIASGCEVYHIVTLDGIVRHLERPGSTFPETDQALERLVAVGEVVAIPRSHGQPLPIKVVPDTSRDIDLKPDRQARVLLADFGEYAEGIIVMDLGGRQVSVRIRGPQATNLFYTCLDFYASCDALTQVELQEALARRRA